MTGRFTGKKNKRRESRVDVYPCFGEPGAAAGGDRTRGPDDLIIQIRKRACGKEARSCNAPFEARKPAHRTVRKGEGDQTKSREAGKGGAAERTRGAQERYLLDSPTDLGCKARALKIQKDWSRRGKNLGCLKEGGQLGPMGSPKSRKGGSTSKESSAPLETRKILGES